MSIVNKKIVPVQVNLIKSKKEGSAFVLLNKSNYIPDVYALNSDEARVVERYLDDSYQWVRLTDGRRLRTRELKQNLHSYMPGTISQTSGHVKGLKTRHLGLRVLSLDKHYKHRVGYMYLARDGIRLNIKHVVNNVESEMYLDIYNPNMFDPVIELVKDYQMAFRVRSRIHKHYFDTFMHNLVNVIECYSNFNLPPK